MPETRPTGLTATPTHAGTPAAYIEALRALKQARGYSLRELQRRSGLPRSTIANILNPARPQLPPLNRVTALLRALDLDEGEARSWGEEWLRLQQDLLHESRRAQAQPAQPDPAQRPEVPDLPEAGTAATPVLRGRGRGIRERRALTHTLALALGLLLGVAGTLALTGPRVPLGYPTDPTGCPSGVAPAPPGSDAHQGTDAAPASPGSARPSWIGRPAFEAAILGGTQVVLPVIREVTGGDALVVTVMLTSTCAGEVHATDTQGNTYRIAGDVTDASRHRTLILAAFDVRPLGTADQITLDYPHSSKYHVAVDEFRGIHAVVGHAEGYGPFGGTAFTTSGHPLACRSGDLMVGTVGSNTGTPPQFVADWTSLTPLELSSYKLTTAYRVAAVDGRCAATGTTTAEWGAVLVTFR